MGLLGKIWYETFGKDMLSLKETEDEMLKLGSGNYMSCSECGEVNLVNDNYCAYCGHKLKKINENDELYREYCPVCKEKITKDMNYCGGYGHKIDRENKNKRCPVCGEWVVSERYCLNCGHDFYLSNFYNKNRRIHQGDMLSKKCPHCNSKQKETYQYCEYCGTKLEYKGGLI